MSAGKHTFTPEMLDAVERILRETEDRLRISEENLKTMGSLGILTSEDLANVKLLDTEVEFTSRTLATLPIVISGFSSDGQKAQGRFIGFAGFNSDSGLLIAFSHDRAMHSGMSGALAPLGECTFQIAAQ